MLQRLAATKAMFGEPITKIRDVAEATDASPELIARILSDIRSPGEVARIEDKLENHHQRLTALEESRRAELKTPKRLHRPELFPIPPKHTVGNVVEEVEQPPKAWGEHKVKQAHERGQEVQQRLNASRTFLIRYLAILALAIFVAWIVYSTLTSPVPPPPIGPISN